MTSRIGKLKNAKPRNGSGFTLIELILVMTIMLVVLGVSYPSLKGFFHGHNIEYEARRFMALTRDAQSQAVSDGVPMILWVNPKQGTYGLQPQQGYSTASSNMLQYAVDPEVRVEISAPPTGVTTSNIWSQTLPSSAAQALIRFLPDGFVSETSPQKIIFRQGDRDVIGITETTNRLRYEIDTNQIPTRRR